MSPRSTGREASTVYGSRSSWCSIAGCFFTGSLCSCRCVREFVTLVTVFCISLPHGLTCVVRCRRLARTIILALVGDHARGCRTGHWLTGHGGTAVCVRLLSRPHGIGERCPRTLRSCCLIIWHCHSARPTRPIVHLSMRWMCRLPVPPTMLASVLEFPVGVSRRRVR